VFVVVSIRKRPDRNGRAEPGCPPRRDKRRAADSIDSRLDSGPGHDHRDRPDDAVGADHLLRRASFGVTATGRVRIAQLGIEGWLDEQLDPTSIDDSAMDELLVALPTIELMAQELRDSYRQQRGLIVGELTLAKLTRAGQDRAPPHLVPIVESH
jgi:hypothetical protein